MLQTNGWVKGSGQSKFLDAGCKASASSRRRGGGARRCWYVCCFNRASGRRATVLETLFWSYQTTVEEFEKLSEAVLDKLAADQTPSADLLASEEAARSAVLAA